jgi:hypothetical protein
MRFVQPRARMLSALPIRWLHASVRASMSNARQRTGQRLGPKGASEGPIGIGGRGTSSWGGLGAVTCGGVRFFAGFCCVTFPALPFFRSCCFMSAGAEAKAPVISGTAFGWAVTGASGLGWSAIGISGAAAEDLA